MGLGLSREATGQESRNVCLNAYISILKSHGPVMNVFKRFRLYTYCICLSSLAKFGLRQPSHADISSAPAHPLDLAKRSV